MNKRIRELAEQAYGIDDSKPFHPSALVALEKFAELIVRECIDLCWSHASVDGTSAKIEESIKEHFGIEE